jgi:uncharacterized protein DUF6916
LPLANPMTGTQPFATITRRTLLLAGAGAAATVAIPEAAKGASKRWTRKFASYKLRSNWEPLVGSTFTAGTAWGAVSVRLIAVEDIPNLSGQSADFRERSFVLTFEGGPLAAETYRFSHKKLGKPKLAITSGSASAGTFSIVMSNAKLRRKPKRLRKAKKHRATREDRRNAKKQKRRETPKAPEPQAAPAPEPQAEAPKAAPDAPTFEPAN